MAECVYTQPIKKQFVVSIQIPVGFKVYVGEDGTNNYKLNLSVDQSGLVYTTQRQEYPSVIQLPNPGGEGTISLSCVSEVMQFSLAGSFNYNAYVDGFIANDEINPDAGVPIKYNIFSDSQPICLKETYGYTCIKCAEEYEALPNKFTPIITQMGSEYVIDDMGNIIPYTPEDPEATKKFFDALISCGTQCIHARFMVELRPAGA